MEVLDTKGKKGYSVEEGTIISELYVNDENINVADEYGLEGLVLWECLIPPKEDHVFTGIKVKKGKAILTGFATLQFNKKEIAEALKYVDNRRRNLRA